MPLLRCCGLPAQTSSTGPSSSSSRRGPRVLVGARRQRCLAALALALLASLVLTAARPACVRVVVRPASSNTRRRHCLAFFFKGAMASTTTTTPPTSPPPAAAAAAAAAAITSPSSLCSAYDELAPAVDFFALHAAASGHSSDSSSEGSPPFVASAGDDRFPPSRKRPRRGPGSGSGGGSASGDEGIGGQRKKQQPPPRRKPPTHFLAVRVDSPEILAEVARVQAWVVEQEKRLDAVMVPPAKLHLTLATVLHCHEDGQVERAVAVLEEVMAKDVRPYLLAQQHSKGNDNEEEEQEDAGAAEGGPLLPPSLRFPGLGAFGSRVLFIRPCEEHAGTKQLQHVSRLIWERLHAEGLALEPPPRTPDGIQLHGTVAKASKVGPKNARYYQIRREHWARFERWNLEDSRQYQRFEAVQLLRMKGDAATGYYEEEASWYFVVEEAKGPKARGGEESQASAASAASTVVAAAAGGSEAVAGAGAETMPTTTAREGAEGEGGQGQS